MMTLMSSGGLVPIEMASRFITRFSLRLRWGCSKSHSTFITHFFGRTPQADNAQSTNGQCHASTKRPDLADPAQSIDQEAYELVAIDY